MFDAVAKLLLISDTRSPLIFSGIIKLLAQADFGVYDKILRLSSANLLYVHSSVTLESPLFSILSSAR